MEISQFSAGTGTSKNWYNGKEIQDDFGLYWYDYGARFYDPALGRWHSVDPKADWYYSMSPYNYAANNPIILKDPNGQWLETAWDAFSLGTGVTSFINNVRQGNVGAAIVDGVGVVVDAAAVVLPVIPGGAGAGLKALRVADNAVDAAQTAKVADKATDGAKKINKNSNNAEGNFVLYDVKDKNGNTVKVGKADADRTNAAGDPVRMKDSERKAQKDYPGATATVVPNSKTNTTGASKEAEAARVRNKRANGEPLPLNKERDKRYHNN